MRSGEEDSKRGKDRQGETMMEGKGDDRDR